MGDFVAAHTHKPALQDIGSPDGVCYGCGPANPDGLQIKSYWSDDGQYVIATFEPLPKHTGWKHWLYGGLIASLIDCHSNWTAIAFMHRMEGREVGTQPFISCVTGTLNVKYLKPTPIRGMVHLRSRVEGEITRKARVVCDFIHGETMETGEITAQGDSIFVRVDPSLLEG